MIAGPILFLDIDGVLTPTTGAVPPGYHRVTVGDSTVVVGIEHAAWLTELADVFEIVWATSWESSANSVYAAALGLPERQYVEFPRPHGGISWKLPRIREVARERAVAWVDDELYEDETAWAEERAAPTLLVRTKGSVGLERSHVVELLAWPARLEGDRARKRWGQALTWATVCVLLAGAAWWASSLVQGRVGELVGAGLPLTVIVTAGLLAGILVEPDGTRGGAARFVATAAWLPATLLSLAGGPWFLALIPIIWGGLTLIAAPAAMCGRWVARQWRRPDRADAWDLRVRDVVGVVLWLASFAGLAVWAVGAWPDASWDDLRALVPASGGALGVLGGVLIRPRRPMREAVRTAITLGSIPVLAILVPSFVQCSSDVECNTQGGGIAAVFLLAWLGLPIAAGHLLGRAVVRAVSRRVAVPRQPAE